MNTASKTRYNAEYMRRKNKERLAQGLCKRCGIRPLVTKVMCRICRDDENLKQNARWQRIRQEVLNHYGAPYCACCKQHFDYEFLHLDHVDGGGNDHRRTFSKRGDTNAATQVYRWIRREKFPVGFQALCANCNMAKSLYTVCPHQAKLALYSETNCSLVSST